MYAVTEDRFTPAASSRYLRGRFVWPTTGREEPDRLVAGGAPLTLFTGVKVRSWPPHAGMTACAYVVDNPELARMTTDFIKRIGFTGIADLDWRFDRRDGRYRLLDFNPRMGAQFRLFENTVGVDVVRAQHLDLTGRTVPEGAQRAGHRFVVENVDLPALFAYRRSDSRAPHAPARASGTELAWFAGDDPLQFFTMLARSAGPGARHLMQLRRAVRRAGADAPPRQGEGPK